MFASERQQVILDRARQDGRVDVQTLAADLQVTQETIRRDLTTLERRRLLRRTHGGAVPVEKLDFEPQLSVRETLHVDEKQRIARAALDELPEEGAVLLDSGTTTAALAQLIPDDRELTVVTNGMSIALILADRPNITLHTVGGRLRPRTLASVGDWAERELREVFVDVAFVGANGVSVARGLTTPDRAEAAVKRTMIASARRTVVLADHTKFEADHFAQFGHLADIDVIVTDTSLDADLVTEVGGAGPRMVQA
ncbi:DeoR/GlpR family DNA-binding transcription regulator [Kineosporia sp. NBRC 101731]|uniref:DeoR/GlpR family DNA-binding transcription regulator n=1 Tax=Kineosporia sp. NBRC 101731 TaxID=3032199 RepID=UPI0024A30CF8|nr:DeoR/GlpR family DNA-binding transcription regulator [Kineosporia sp. NBRC 101731]GLY32270.1 DeoR family transcriptional regulator [Kineosporia sp. NBRC 101731]